MLEHTTHLERLLIAAAGVTLALGMAASAGAMPGLAAGGPAPTEVVAQLAPAAAPAVVTLVDAAAPPPPAAVEVPAPVAPPAAAAAKPVAATAPTKKPPVAVSTNTQPQARPAVAPAPVAALAAAVPAPAAVATVARRTPSSEEIKSTISELKRQVGGLLRFVSPTADQINQAGDQVCTGFDNGETFAQVKATGLSMMPDSVDVSPATADWAVRQLVTMYCPGHADKLV